MVTDVKSLQPEKARSPIEVTPNGMVTVVKPLERSNLYSLVVATLDVKELYIFKNGVRGYALRESPQLPQKYRVLIEKIETLS